MTPPKPKGLILPIVLSVSALVLIGISFLGGIQYQKSHTSAAPVAATAAPGQNFQGGGGRQGGFGGRRPTTGTVASIDATNMTITTATGTTTVLLTASSTVTDGATASAATLADIKVGEEVLVFGTIGTDDTLTAQRITVNPTTQRPPAASQENL